MLCMWTDRHSIAGQQQQGRGNRDKNQKSRYQFSQIGIGWRKAHDLFRAIWGCGEGRDWEGRTRESEKRKSICPVVGFERKWDTEGAQLKRSGRDRDVSSVSRERK